MRNDSAWRAFEGFFKAPSSARLREGLRDLRPLYSVAVPLSPTAQDRRPRAIDGACWHAERAGQWDRQAAPRGGQHAEGPMSRRSSSRLLCLEVYSAKVKRLRAAPRWRSCNRRLHPPHGTDEPIEPPRPAEGASTPPPRPLRTRRRVPRGGQQRTKAAASGRFMGFAALHDATRRDGGARRRDHAAAAVQRDPARAHPRGGGGGGGGEGGIATGGAAAAMQTRRPPRPPPCGAGRTSGAPLLLDEGQCARP